VLTFKNLLLDYIVRLYRFFIIILRNIFTILLFTLLQWSLILLWMLMAIIRRDYFIFDQVKVIFYWRVITDFIVLGMPTE